MCRETEPTYPLGYKMAWEGGPSFETDVSGLFVVTIRNETQLVLTPRSSFAAAILQRYANSNIHAEPHYTKPTENEPYRVRELVLGFYPPPPTPEKPYEITTTYADTPSVPVEFRRKPRKRRSRFPTPAQVAAKLEASMAEQIASGVKSSVSPEALKRFRKRGPKVVSSAKLKKSSRTRR